MSETTTAAPPTEPDDPIVHAVTVNHISRNGQLVKPNTHIRLARSLAEDFLRRGAIRKLTKDEAAQVKQELPAEENKEEDE